MPALQPFFIEQNNALELYQKSFFGFLQELCRNSAKGLSAGNAYRAAWNWGVNSLALDSSEVAKAEDLLSILSSNKEVKVQFNWQGQERVATVYWKLDDDFPVVV
jgi:hypothetical protein